MQAYFKNQNFGPVIQLADFFRNELGLRTDWRNGICSWISYISHSTRNVDADVDDEMKMCYYLETLPLKAEFVTLNPDSSFSP